MMKRIVILLFFPISGMSAISAETVISLRPVNVETFFHDFDWIKISCEISPKKTRPKGRSVISAPELYHSMTYLCMRSRFVNCDDVRITIIDMHGAVVKSDVIQIVSGDENLYYIGDIESGTYEVIVEFDDFLMFGEFEIL